jgi:hypothetical protein
MFGWFEEWKEKSLEELESKLEEMDFENTKKTEKMGKTKKYAKRGIKNKKAIKKITET